MGRFRYLVLRLGIAGLLALSASAGHAADPIGHVTAASDVVTGVLDGTTTPLKAGDPIFLDEVVQTGAQGRASLTFLDGAAVSLGASSAVKLSTASSWIECMIRRFSVMNASLVSRST